MKDIEGLEDIKVFVDGFYGKIQQDDLLGPVFASKISADQWPAHLERMYSFWGTVLRFKYGFKGNPGAKHMTLPVSAEHFDRWIELFHGTIDTNFEGPMADETKKRSATMALMFMHKINHLRNNPGFQPVM
jgi:hemoglobin